MTRPEIVDRSSFEVLLDNRGRDIRLARDGGCISELLGDPLHNCRHRPLLFLFRCRKSVLRRVLREIDRGKKRAAPRPEVLGRELVPKVDLHVVVEPLAGEVVELALPAVLEDARAALDLQQPANRFGEILVDELGTYSDARLRGKRELDAFPTDADVTPEQRRDAVRSLAGISLGADAEPTERNEVKRDGRNALTVELVLVEVLGHRSAQPGQAVAEANQAVVLLLLLRCAVIRVVQVLLSPGFVVAGRLDLRVRPWRDPDVGPRGWYHERLDALENGGVANRLSLCVDVAKRAFAPDPARHLPFHNDTRLARDARRADNRRPRGGRDGAGAARGEPACPRTRGDRGRARVPAVRSVARAPPRNRKPGRDGGGRVHPRARPRAEGRDDHAGGARRRRLAESHPARGDRGQGHRPDRTADSGSRTARWCACADLDRPDGRRRRVRRQGVA